MTDHLEAASGRPVAQSSMTGTPTMATEQEPARVALHLLAEMLPTANADVDSLTVQAIVQAGLQGDAAFLEAERERLLVLREPVVDVDAQLVSEVEHPEGDQGVDIAATIAETTPAKPRRKPKVSGEAAS